MKTGDTATYRGFESHSLRQYAPQLILRRTFYGGCMCFQYLCRRLFHRAEWQQALKCEQGRMGLYALNHLTAQRIYREHQNVIRITEKIKAGSSTAQTPMLLSQLQMCTSQLTSLSPFASPSQRLKIEDAVRTADYARSLLPAPKEETPTQMTYYSVYIPTLQGAFYYLGSQVYAVGDIVSIPFGRENNIIFGIVEGIVCDEYWKLPIPLWKMKYIEGKAPQAVADEYRRQNAQ